VTVITVASIILILALVLLFQGANVLFATHLGAATFYRVVPFAAMTRGAFADRAIRLRYIYH
jgi:hypothetical protein